MFYGYRKKESCNFHNWSLHSTSQITRIIGANMGPHAPCYQVCLSTALSHTCHILFIRTPNNTCLHNEPMDVNFLEFISEPYDPESAPLRVRCWVETRFHRVTLRPGSQIWKQLHCNMEKKNFVPSEDFFRGVWAAIIVMMPNHPDLVICSCRGFRRNRELGGYYYRVGHPIQIQQ